MTVVLFFMTLSLLMLFSDSKKIMLLGFSLEIFSLGVLFLWCVNHSTEVVFLCIVLLVFSSVVSLVTLILNMRKYSEDTLGYTFK